MALPPDQRQYIQRLRGAMKLPWRKMAEAAGVSHPTVMGWVSGTQEPSQEQHRKLLGYLHEEERKRASLNPVTASKRKRVTRSVLASTTEPSTDDSMISIPGSRSITYSEPISGNRSWPREVVDLSLSPDVEIGEIIIVEEKDPEPGQAVEAKLGDRFVHRFLWKVKGSLVLKDGSGLMEDVSVEKTDLRGVVVQRIESLPGEITRTTEYKHGLRRKF